MFRSYEFQGFKETRAWSLGFSFGENWGRVQDLWWGLKIKISFSGCLGPLGFTALGWFYDSSSSGGFFNELGVVIM